MPKNFPEEFMKKIGIVFDCDGTLIDSENQVIQSIQFSLEKLGAPEHSAPEIKKLFGPGADQILLTLLDGDESKASKAFDYYLESQTKKAMEMKVYPEVRSLLDAIKSAGIPMGLVTGRHSQDLEIVLNAHQLKKYFYVIVSDDDLRLPKPSPEGLLNAAYLMKLPIEDIYYVGDAKTDLQTATFANANGVAALWDERVDAEEMRLENPVMMAESPLQILKLLS
jgi:HAD superfamily hydrolase (TIGR01549 family)